MKQGTKALYLGLVALLCSASAKAITINWSAAGSALQTYSGGKTCLVQGCLLKLGMINTTEDNMLANQDDISFVNNSITAWGTAQVGARTGLDGTFVVSTTKPSFGIIGKQVYLLAFNAPTVDAATQVGLYTNPNWIGPSTGTVPLNMDLSDPGLQIVIGAFSAGTIEQPPNFAGSDAVQLHVIPEPSSILLVAMGLLGMVGSIRRRS